MSFQSLCTSILFKQGFSLNLELTDSAPLANELQGWMHLPLHPSLWDYKCMHLTDLPSV